MLVSAILDLLASLAPPGLAASWDNVGLQVGSPDWTADKILLTLDVTPAVLEYATKHKFDLILSHHPLIFQPVNAVTRPDLLTLVEHKIAVIALHTNLDVVPQGVNYALAEALGLKVLHILSPETGSKWYHGSVTVPPLYAEMLLNAIHKAGAGRIGFYDNCATLHDICGTFKPLEGSNPHLGRQDRTEKVDEVEIEFMVDSFNLAAVKQAISATHPYETPAVYFVETQNSNPAYGLGLVCALPKATKLATFAAQVKTRLKAPFVQLWTAGKDKDIMIKTVALCGGAGGSLIPLAANQADVYVTGDINYHARLDSRIPLIDAGHFYTEFPVLAKLAALLKAESISTTAFPLVKHEVNHNLLI